MGLFKKIFNVDKADQSDAGPSTQIQDHPDSADSSAESRNAPRRELVQVVLRDTMRQHGIPSDWIDCRILADAGQRNSSRTGLHVQLIVRQGHDRMLTYVPAFQGSFFQGLAKFEPRARDWLLSLAWEFDGLQPVIPPAPPAPVMPAIAAIPAANAKSPGAGQTANKEDAADSQDDEQVSQDIKALFAIRDAAFLDDPSHGHVDFQQTRPGE